MRAFSAMPAGVIRYRTLFGFTLITFTHPFLNKPADEQVGQTKGNAELFRKGSLRNLLPCLNLAQDTASMVVVGWHRGASPLSLTEEVMRVQ